MNYIYKYLLLYINVFSLYIPDVQCLNLNVKSMSFNVNKDSLWLSYPLKRTSFGELSEKIPKTHQLAKCKVFKEDTNDYRLFFNLFQVKTPFFTGNRLEVVTIIKNIKTNQNSFVVLDCFTDAMSWDPIGGIQKENCIINKKINNFDYNIVVKKIEKNDISNNGNNNNNKHTANKLSKIFNLRSKRSVIKKRPVKEFSVEPNYICYFKNYPIGYNMTFDENQIDKNVILLKDVKLYNNIYQKFVKDLEYVFIYPQIMNFKIFLK
jgi:hypothetical protein